MSLAVTSGSLAGAERAARRHAAFRAAARHTMLVRFLRRAIPVGSALAVVGLIAVPFLRPPLPVESVSISGASLSGGKVVMESPRLAGFRQDNQPYEVTARSALQDIRNPTQIELVDMKARIQVKDQGWITVESRTGLFESQKEQLRLVDQVKVLTESGYDIRMRSADIDFKAGSVKSAEPVTVSVGTATIDADTLDVKNNGAVITFEGRVRTVIQNAPAKILSGPEREGSTPMPEALARPGTKP